MKNKEQDKESNNFDLATINNNNNNKRSKKTRVKITNQNIWIIMFIHSLICGEIVNLKSTNSRKKPLD